MELPTPARLPQCRSIQSLFMPEPGLEPIGQRVWGYPDINTDDHEISSYHLELQDDAATRSFVVDAVNVNVNVFYCYKIYNILETLLSFIIE